MLAAERRRAIADLIRRQSTVRLKELSETLKASDSTIRRDLAYLEQQGVLERTYGGAIATRQENVPGIHGPAVSFDANGPLTKGMRRIGAAAADMIEQGETVFVGAGPLSLAVAHQIARKRSLTVVTNALDVATYLARASALSVILTGGQVERQSSALLGHVAELALRELRADRAIISVGGIHVPDGFTGTGLPEVQFLRVVIDLMPEVIVVVDSHRWGHVGPAYLAPLEAVDTIVTGLEAPPAMVWDLSQLGIQIVQA